MENKITIKERVNSIGSFLKQKKTINTIVIILFFALLITSSYMRFQNLPLLIDSTTGEYIPLALDPFYFLRIAETLESGSLPVFDMMKKPFDVGWSPEILPQALVGMHKISKIFGEYSLQYIDVISPVIFFILGLIVFFFLVYKLTNSKIIALLSSTFLAFIPPYLYRTMAGFADHEAIGMFAFLLTMLVFTITLKSLKKEMDNKKILIKSLSFGLLLGIVSSLTIASWNGIANFIFIVIPLSFLIFWLMNYKEYSEKKLISLILFYSLWLISSIGFGTLFGFNLFSLISKFILSAKCLISIFVLLFMIFNFAEKVRKKQTKKDEIIHSLILTIGLGIVTLLIFRQNPITLISTFFGTFLHPFGLERISLTVAENIQPYLNNLMTQIGQVFFWMFIGGLVFLGVEIGKGIKLKKERYSFNVLWCLMFMGILFHRFSSTSILNGVNFISGLFYVGGILLFMGYGIKLYLKDSLKISFNLIITSVLMFIFILSGMSAGRFFFVLMPFVCFSSGFFIVKTFEHLKRNKDELVKMFLILLLVLSIVGGAYSLFNFYQNSNVQAQYTGPSANYQWQGAMQFVRQNTEEKSIFVHWWDYGYWVEYLGERPTLADGGHFQGEFRTHMIGRYVLTNPKPEIALSFFKSNDVSYLLIDSTDLGKYGAYSKIGSDESWDRFSYFNPFIIDRSKTMETSNKIIDFYLGGQGVDEDIVYEENGSEIFIPGPTYDEIGTPDYKAIIGGVKLTFENETIFAKPPELIVLYNNEQILIPVRYIYFNGRINDFGEGLDSVFFLFPKLDDSSQGGVTIDGLGAGFYLSPKVSKSLFAQLYLMNNTFNNYETIKLAHSEDDQILKSLKIQGVNLGDFVYYKGFRGPIKIWDVREIPKDILFKKEFLDIKGEWAGLDNLEVLK